MRGVGERGDSAWTEAHEKRVGEGHPAVVRGYGVSTESSEWQGGTGHAVTVLSPTTDGDAFVAFDPDTTHDPRTSPPSSSAAPREVRQDLRIMSREELRRVGQVHVELGPDNTSSLPVVEQRGPTFMGGVGAQIGALLWGTPKK